MLNAVPDPPDQNPPNAHHQNPLKVGLVDFLFYCFSIYIFFLMQALKHKNSYMESTEHVKHVDSIELQPLNTQLLYVAQSMCYLSTDSKFSCFYCFYLCNSLISC